MHESFEIIDRRALPDVSGEGLVLRHRVTGAEVLAVCNPDPEMVFGITFETVPRQSNGVAHLLEHLVFRGSQRYPHTNLYAGLAQGTLLTGLNASTRADTTLFHFSGTHHADFSTLMDVLLDAVFHPLLRDQDILEEREVVKNEMAGHHAIPQNKMLENLRQALLPQTPYAVDFGGVPELVNQLTPEELRCFHAVHYRPACARIFLWGNIDLTARLGQLDQLLGSRTDSTLPSRVSAKTVPPAGHVKATFAAPEGGPFMTGFGWAFEVDNIDLWDTLAIALFAEPNGILRKAMSDVGGRVIGRGFSSDTPLGTFEIALADHPPEAGPLVIAKVRQTLDQLARDGMGENWFLGAVDRLELQLRSFGRPSQMPLGLRALNMILGRWRHGADPLALLDIGSRITDLSQTIASDPMTVERLLAYDLVENPHNIVVSLEPRADVNCVASPPPRAKPTPDPTKRAANPKLPFIKRDDLPSQVSRIAFEVDQGVLHVPAIGPDLCRGELAISLSGLCAQELELVPIFAALLKAANPSEKVEISARCWAGAGHGRADGAWLFLSGRSLPSCAGLLLDRMRETLQQKIPGADTIGQRIKTELAALDAQIASLGHIFCETRLRALGTPAGTWGERLNGLARKSTLNRLVSQNPAQLSAALTQLQQRLLGDARADLAVSGVTPSLADQFIAELSRTENHGKPPQHLDLAINEGIPTSAPNFTTGQALRFGATGPAHVVAHMLETGWLWDSVRVAGGAYSVRCRYDAGDGLLTLLSIRDPHPLSTLDRFREAPIWLQHNARDDLLERCIAAKTGHLVRPVRPDDILTIALQRRLCGETDDLRQSALEDVRIVSAASINLFSQKFEADLAQARTVILGPQGGLHSALSERFNAFEMQPD